MFLLFSSKQSSIILKKVGRIGGNSDQVRSRVCHILSCIDNSIEFSVSEVRVHGAAHSARPPIYEAILEDADSAVALRKAFARFTRKKDPVACPPELKGVEVFNSATLATQVRVSILRVSHLAGIFVSGHFS